MAISRLNTTRRMSREKRKSEPPNPATTEEFHDTLTDDHYRYLRRTEDGGSDFYLDTIRDAGNEIEAVGFGSRRVLQELRNNPAEAGNIFMDGTFKVVPRQPPGLRQLFSIHVLYMNVVFPVIYFLMTRQTQQAYERVLEYVRAHFITWNVTCIITDFETSLMNVVRRLFVGAEHHGCWFHYCQAIWRSVVRLGLANLCRRNEIVMRVVKMIMALPHLPPNRGPPNSQTIPQFSIRDGLASIRQFIIEGNLDPRLHDLVAYVRRFWIGHVGPATFTVFGLPRRTNNNLESFHAKLLAAFGPHSNIWVFLRRLQRIEHETYGDFRRLEQGIEIRRFRIHLNRLNTPAIREAVGLLINHQITIVHFLRRLAHRVDGLINVLAHPLQMADADLRPEEADAIQAEEDEQVVDDPAPVEVEPGNAMDGVVPEAADGGVAALPQVQRRGGRGPRRGRGEGRGRGRGRGQRRPRGLHQPQGEREADDPDDPPPLQPPAGLRLPNLCVVCINNVATHVVVPCGHLCMCGVCAVELPNHQILERRCPLCNQNSQTIIRVFYN